MRNLSAKYSQGQALLIILLIMAVALTIGLSLVSRSITDIKISQQTEESARAFSAAEAGIESALVGEALEWTFSETGAGYVASATEVGAGSEFAFPQAVDREEIQTLWLANNDDLNEVYNRGSLRVVWGNSGTILDSNAPALEISLYYKDESAVIPYRVAKFALDPYSGRSPDPAFCNPGEGSPQCDGVSSFSTAGELVGGKGFQYGAALNIASFTGSGKTALFARLRLLYSTSSHLLGAKADGAGTSLLPTQGIKIESTGTVGTTTRKVEVVRFHPAPPSILDFVLYSSGGLSK